MKHLTSEEKKCRSPSKKKKEEDDGRGNNNITSLIIKLNLIILGEKNLRINPY